MRSNSKGAARLAAIVVGAVFPALGFGAFQVYVSPSGNDAASGLSSSTPVQTIGRAMVVLHAQRGSNTSTAATINVAAGRYQLTSPIALNTWDTNLTIVGPTGGAAIISGGVLIPSWSKTLPANIRARISPAVVNSIYSAPVPSGNLGVFQRRGGAEPGTTFLNLPAELLMSGRPMALPRFPSTGWARVTSVASDGVTATLNMSRRVAASTDAWVQGFWSTEWWQTWEPMTSAPNPSTVQVSGLAAGSPLGPVAVGSRMAIVNSLEDLSEPGQYYIDRTANQVYFDPPPMLSGATWLTEISQIDGYLFSGYQCNNLLFKNLVLQGSRGEGIKLYACTNSGLDTCVVRSTQLEGVLLSNGSNNFVRNCSIHDTGSVGVLSIEGTVATLTSGGDVITNNTFSNPGRLEQTDRPAVWIRGVGGTVSSNTILNCPGQAIMIDGCNQHILDNDISHTCQTMNDVGTIYAGRNLLNRGDLISGNILHDIQPVILPLTGSPVVAGVYLDDFTSGFTVQDNIFANLDIGVLIGGGRSNTVSGNAFEAVTSPVWIDARGVTWEASFYAAGGPFSQQIGAMSSAELNLFKATYPDFANMMSAANPALPQNNDVDVAYFPVNGVGVLYLDETYTVSLLGLQGILYNGDIIFVDPVHGNFNLVSGANVNTWLPVTAGSSGAASG